MSEASHWLEQHWLSGHWSDQHWLSDAEVIVEPGLGVKCVFVHVTSCQSSTVANAVRVTSKSNSYKTKTLVERC